MPECRSCGQSETAGGDLCLTCSLDDMSRRPSRRRPAARCPTCGVEHILGRTGDCVVCAREARVRAEAREREEARERAREADRERGRRGPGERPRVLPVVLTLEIVECARCPFSKAPHGKRMCAALTPVRPTPTMRGVVADWCPLQRGSVKVGLAPDVHKRPTEPEKPEQDFWTVIRGD